MCFSGTATLSDLAKKVKPLPGLRGELTQAQQAHTVVGWRAWKVDDGSFDPLLKSLFASAVWKPGQPMDTHGKITESNTGTGVHAWKTLDSLLAYLQTSTKPTEKTSVIGQIVLWGKLATHQDGYRAEHGYPLQIWVNSPALQVKLRNKYDIFVGRALIPQMITMRKAA